MALIEINRNPSRRELNWFGAILAVFFALVGALVLWQAQWLAAAGVIWAIAALAVVVYYAFPPLRRPLYLCWMFAAFPIGWVLSQLVLALVYYLVLTPIALLMRLVGHDPLNRRFDTTADTYWVPHNPAADTSRYFRQF